MTQTPEIIQTLMESFRDRSIETRSSRISDFSRQESYRCEWKSNESKIRVEIYNEENTRVLLNSILVEKNVSDRSSQYLGLAADSVVRRLIYLPQFFSVIELNSISNAVLLRSSHPESRSGEISYFEIILKHGAWFGQRNVLSLKKYESHRNSKEPRIIAPFLLTKAQLQRLLIDFLEIL